jgi:hypothetical protein
VTLPSFNFHPYLETSYGFSLADPAVNYHRLLQGFVLQRDPVGPTKYFLAFAHWDNLTHNTLVNAMTLLGDGLVVSLFQ